MGAGPGVVHRRVRVGNRTLAIREHEQAPTHDGSSVRAGTASTPSPSFPTWSPEPNPGRRHRGSPCGRADGAQDGVLGGYHMTTAHRRSPLSNQCLSSMTPNNS